MSSNWVTRDYAISLIEVAAKPCFAKRSSAISRMRSRVFRRVAMSLSYPAVIDTAPDCTSQATPAMHARLPNSHASDCQR